MTNLKQILEQSRNAVNVLNLTLKHAQQLHQSPDDIKLIRQELESEINILHKLEALNKTEV